MTTGEFGIAEFGIAEFGSAEFGSYFNTQIITSKTTLVYNRGLESYKNSFDILYNQFSFKKHITYRRYVFGEDNLSGDKDYRDYNDYNIVVEMQFEGETRDVTESGYVVSNFGVLFLPAIIKEERDGTPIPSFRPQIKDEFYFDGDWYIIQNIQPAQFVTNTLGMECLFRLIAKGDTNPR